jgi:RNA methyltransferase, TrmH family
VRLTSTHNPLVKYVRSLERAAVRRASGEYVAEGVRLLREAFTADQMARVVLYDAEALQRTPEGARLMTNFAAWAVETYEVDPHVMKAVSQTDHPAGALAVLKFPAVPPLEVQRERQFGVVLDALSDPGNAGTIVRTALAVGADYLVSTPTSTDLFGPKAVRAGMGAHFTLPLYPAVTWEELNVALAGTSFVAASASGEETLHHFAWPDRSALVIGSEAHGLSPQAATRIDARIRIPMKPGVESLNAAVAAGILMYAAHTPIRTSESERYK